MTYNFDTIIDRHGTGALKTDALQVRYGNPDLLPLWVADMDFATPSFIIDAIKKRLDHPILGYEAQSDELQLCIASWLDRLHGLKVEPSHIAFIPGIVKGIGMAVNFFTSPGDGIIIQPPVYHPFRLTPIGNGRKVLSNPLILNPNGSYSMDFKHLELLADRGDCKMLILSNPHNPAGICWDKNTLKRLAKICHDNNIIVISDEIHADMALSGHRHIPFASVSEGAAECSITFGAPSKTFNIPGIVSSYTVIRSEKLRTPFFKWLNTNEFDEAPLFSKIATLAAFTDEGDHWRRQMLKYVDENISFLEEYLKENIPSIRPLRPEASFLVWLDCRQLGLDHDSLISLFTDKAGLALNDGEMFGLGGEGFMRINVATPRSILKKALEQVLLSIKGLVISD